MFFQCPHRSSHNVPVNLQQHKYYSLFCNFLSLYEGESVILIPLKVGWSLENGLSCIFQAVVNILLGRCRASMTKDRQQSTRVRARGVDQIRNQIFFFSVPVLLHPQFSNPSMNFTSSNLQCTLCILSIVQFPPNSKIL